MGDASEYQISMAGGDGDPRDTHRAAEAYTQALLTRRRRKCIAQGAHQAQPPDETGPTTCPRCGL